MPGAVPAGRQSGAGELIAARDQHAAWTVAGLERRRRLEARDGLLEPALDIGLPTRQPPFHERRMLLSRLGFAQRLEDLHRLGRARRDDAVDRTPDEAFRRARRD